MKILHFVLMIGLLVYWTLGLMSLDSMSFLAFCFWVAVTFPVFKYTVWTFKLWFPEFCKKVQNQKDEV
jgi:high-affinity Fe2+/Pb2+ permease